jgi:hypothetical protein
LVVGAQDVVGEQSGLVDEEVDVCKHNNQGLLGCGVNPWGQAMVMQTGTSRMEPTEPGPYTKIWREG